MNKEQIEEIFELGAQAQYECWNPQGEGDVGKFAKLKDKAVKLFSIHSVINWVACKEELPIGDAENVLIVHNGNVKVGWYQKHTKLWWLSTTENSKGITHWAELPKPPCL